MLTCTCKTSRVRSPSSIRRTSSSHPCSWNSCCVALEDCLSTLTCVLKCLYKTIHRSNRITTVDWKREGRIRQYPNRILQLNLLIKITARLGNRPYSQKWTYSVKFFHSFFTNLMCCILSICSWSTPNGVLTAHTELVPGVWLGHSVPPLQYI